MTLYRVRPNLAEPPSGFSPEERDYRTKTALGEILPNVEAIVGLYGGRIVMDGVSFAVKGGNAGYLLVNTTAEAAEKIAQLDTSGIVVREEKLREYLVSAFAKATKRQVSWNEARALDKAQLDAVRQPVTDIVARTGGEVIIDGSGYNVQKHKDQYACFMFIRATEEAAQEIASLDGVSSVDENNRMHKIMPAKKSGPKV